jgi:putative DNA primase/helicase
MSAGFTSTEKFRDFICSFGFEPPRSIEPGRFVRFPTNGRRGDDAGWAKFFPDCEGGVVGNFRTGQVEVWRAKRDRPISEAERRAFGERIERQKQEAAALRAREAEKAGKRARAIWERGAHCPG